MRTRDRVWRLVERWLTRRVPPRSIDGVLRDLEDDYTRRVVETGRIAGAIWLWSEARSLAQAYGGARPGHPDPRGLSMHTRLLRWVGSVGQDVRFAVRSLRQSPGFSLTVVLTLGLAIGLCTSLFTVFNALALRTWDVRDPDSIVVPFVKPVGTRGFQNLVTVDEFEYLRARAETVTLIGWETGAASVATGSGSGSVHVQMYGVGPGFFDVFGIPIPRGRGFADADHSPTADAVAGIISHRLWQNIFGEDPEVLGRTIYAGVGRVPVTIVGVVHRGFASLGPRMPIDLMVPGEHLARIDRPGTTERHTLLAGRLRPGRTIAEAEAELGALDRQFRSAASLEGNGIILTGTRPVAQPGRTDDFVPLFASMGAALLLVLLLACANVGNLELARLMGRRGEIAVRLSLGAGRARVMRQVLTEALGLALAAAALGYATAWVLPDLVLRFVDEEAEASLTPDTTVLAFSIILAASAAIAFALAPALRATRGATVTFVTPRAGADRRGRHLRSLLLAAQIALSLTLLTGAGLLTRGLLHVRGADLGFDVHGTSVATVRMPSGVRTRAALDAAGLRLEDALLTAGLGPVGLLNHTPPLSGSPFVTSVRKPEEDEVWNRRTLDRPMSVAAFGVLGLEFVAGGPYDEKPGVHEAVVNETLVRLLYPGEPVATTVGRTLLARRPVSGAVYEPYRLVGVVRDSYYAGPSEVLPIFHAAPQFRQQMHLVFDTQPDAAGRLRTIVEAVQPGATVTVVPVSAAIEAALEFRRTGARLAWIIGLLGLALATIGVFGVFAYFVEERRREIGIRLALGARVPQILRAMFSSHRWSVGGGVAAGLVLSAAAGFVLRGYLFGLSPLDPIAYLGVTAILLVAAALATIVPSRRAWRVDPAVTLRAE
jgi:predicted permease